MPRFVILRHELPSGQARSSHWDLMFQCGEVLRTWAVSEEPGSAVEIEARQLADHRLSYLDYEGPVSGDRGSVNRWDNGEYQVEASDTGHWKVRLRGARLQGLLTFRRPAEASHFWRVSFVAAPKSG